jgi:Skp family chaperone for outer membrane proteins
MKHFLNIALFLVNSFVMSQNIAYVSQDSILAFIPEYKKNSERINDLTTNYQKEIQESRLKVSKQVEELLSDRKSVV